MAFIRSTTSARLVGAVAVATLTATGLGVGVVGPSTVGATSAIVQTTPPAPEPTPAPPEAPAPTTAPGEDSSDDSTDWLPIVLIIVGVVALLVILGMVLGRGSKKPAPAPGAGQASPQSNLLSTSQWIHDQLTLELAAADPASAKQRWASERGRLDNVAIGAQQQWSEGHGDAWHTLSQTMSALATAVDTNINLRSQTPPDATLISESTDVVNRQRAALQQLITAMWPTIRR
jgi:hypothetical protein